MESKRTSKQTFRQETDQQTNFQTDGQANKLSDRRTRFHPTNSVEAPLHQTYSQSKTSLCVGDPICDRVASTTNATCSLSSWVSCRELYRPKCCSDFLNDLSSSRLLKENLDVRCRSSAFFNLKVIMVHRSAGPTLRRAKCKFCHRAIEIVPKSFSCR